MWLLSSALAQTIVLDGSVLDDGTPFERVPFEVGPGVVEIEVRHANVTAGNTLDWGLEDPAGEVRGWGGGNAEPAVVGVDSASRGYSPGPLPEGTWTVLIGKPDVDTPPLDYLLEVELRGTAMLPRRADRQPYSRAAALENTSRWYAGDFHVHSLESGDATASLDAIAELARSQGLDFVAISDHNVGTQWEFLVAAQQRHPDVLFVPAMEFTTYAGHANAIGSTVPLDFRIGLTEATIAGAVADVHEGGGLFSINHPALDLGDVCLGCAWEHDLDLGLVDAIEIETGGLVPVGALFLEDTIAFWEQGLAQGHRIAAIGGSDDHKAGVDLGFQQSPIGSPTTMVFSDGLAVQGLLDGVRAGRTVVKLQGPDDPMLKLSIAPFDHSLGSVVTTTVRVDGGLGDQVRFVVGGMPQLPISIDTDPFIATFEAELGDAELRIRGELLRDGQRQVVTSPVYLPIGIGWDPPLGCGCGVGSAWPHRWALVLDLISRKRQ